MHGLVALFRAVLKKISNKKKKYEGKLQILKLKTNEFLFIL